MGTEREFILLTVLAEGPTALSTPEVRAFPWRNIKFLKSRSSLEVGTSIKVDDVDYVVAENALQIDLLRDLANTAEEFENLKQLGLEFI